MDVHHRALSKIELEDSSSFLYVLCAYSNNDISLTVSDGVKGWEGHLSNDVLRRQAEECKMGLDSYMSDTVKALTRRDLGDLLFLYSARSLPNNCLELTWKKHLVTENIKYKLGQVDLSPGHCKQILPMLLDFGIASAGVLQNELMQLESEHVRLKRERSEVLARLSDLASNQHSTEEDLFGKFKAVLNEKKAKIRTLIESKNRIVEQNKELLHKMNNSTFVTENCVVADSHTLSRLPAKVSAPTTFCASNTATTSLLGDVQCRPPSPPPPKRRRQTAERQSKSSSKLYPRVLQSGKGKTNAGPGEKNKELDSDELLNML